MADQKCPSNVRHVCLFLCLHLLFPSPAWILASATASPSGSSCRLEVLAPVELPELGLLDMTTLNDTLQDALESAQNILNNTCEIAVDVSYVQCTLRNVTLVIFGKGLYNTSTVIIGPPCLETAYMPGLLHLPAVLWIPLMEGGEGLGQEHYEAVDLGNEVMVSSFGSYNSLARDVLVTLKHFKWIKIAVVYELDEFCTAFHTVFNDVIEGTDLLVFHVSFRASNSSSVRDTLVRVQNKARIILTCMNPEAFAAFMTSATDLEMASGYYAFLHVNLGMWPAAGGTYKMDHALKSLARPVLFIGLQASADMPLNTSDVSSRHPHGQFLDYFHDAIILWAVGRNNSADGRTLNFSNLLVPSGYARTGRLEFDSRGIRRRSHSLLHFQGGHVRPVADLSNGFVIVEELEWPGDSFPTDSFDSPVEEPDNTGEIVGGVLGAMLAVAFVFIVAIMIRRFVMTRVLNKRTWEVDDKDLIRRQQHLTSQNGVPHMRRLTRIETRATLGLGSVCSLDRNHLFAPVGNYKGVLVAVRKLPSNFRLSVEVIADLYIMKELNHDNVNTFVGAHFEPGNNNYALFKYCVKGSLQDVLENEDIALDWMFKLSFSLDIARGMKYIHKSALRSHGNLKSSNCVVDSRWVVKVTDYGVVTLPFADGEDADEMSHQAHCNALLWTAPELLRMTNRHGRGTQRGDVFSFGIVIQEIIFRVGPYGFDTCSPEEIIERVRNVEYPPFRPRIPEDCDVPQTALALMKSCWDECPEQRPDFATIRKRLIDLNGGRKLNMVDNMLALMETYSSRLEQLVAERTQELAQEKAKTDRLLYQMLPQSVAEQLKSGRSVVPEFYDAVSIFFSDIVGFTAIASQSKPLEVVDLLNDLYTAFDDVIYKRDVYKVETIGDAYMCVSGCPRRNGRRHASEIAEMALELISLVTNFRIRHRPHDSLQLRIGLHTGPCAAGVVGMTMPRYCLFGDTVNTASRMESTGKALHIHISSQMQEALEQLDCGFLTLERGFIQVKGKGIHKTYWLVGKVGFTKPLPDTFSRLRQSLEEPNSRAPSPSNASLTVGDGMYSALRKTSVAISHITVTSDNDDAVRTDPPSPDKYAGRGTECTGSESGIDAGFPFPRKRCSEETTISLPPAATQADDVFHNDVTMPGGSTEDGPDMPHNSSIPRIEIS